MAWGSDADVALAGLYHSIYGTESFQAYCLPLDAEGANRQRVREMIGERAEFLAFVNCTMERNSLDEAIAAYAANPGRRRGLLNTADATGPRVHTIRTRPGRPSDAVTHDPATGGRRAGIPEQFLLSEQELLDLTTLHLSDWLQQVVGSNAEHTQEKKMSYSPGYWLIPPHGYAGVREESFRTMAEVLGGAAMESWEAKQRIIDTGGPKAEWVAGEMSKEALQEWDGRGTDAAAMSRGGSPHEAAAQEFRERGWVVCEGVFAQDEVEELAALLSELSAAEVQEVQASGVTLSPSAGAPLEAEQARMISQVDVTPEGVKPRKLDRPYYKHERFRAFALDERLLAICREIFGGRAPLLYADQAFMKAPGGGPKPYHQGKRSVSLGSLSQMADQRSCPQTTGTSTFEPTTT
eukprot:COSAG04_NODE_586_length_12338_cov_16.547839_9_plen_408_part_00